MNYLIPAYVLILAGIIGYEITLWLRTKKLEDFLKEWKKK